MTDESKAVPMLQDASTSEDVRSLLKFGRAQGPAQSDIDRLSQRLSPLVGLSVSDLSGPMADLGTAPLNPPGVSPTVAAAGKGALLKVGASGLTKALVTASLVSAGMVWWALPTAPVHKPVPARAPIVAPVVQPEPVVVQELPRDEPLPSVVEPVEKPARVVRVRVAEAKPPVLPLPVEHPSEMELIRRAQGLRAQPTQALQELNEHARLYPSGMLAQEREVLAIEALLAAGQRSAAEARASTLAQTHPGSAHLRRVRVLLGAGSTE